MRSGRVFAIFTIISSLTLATGMLFSAFGCSGSVDTNGPAVQDEEAQKIGQDKMREFMAKKSPGKVQKKR